MADNPLIFCDLIEEKPRPRETFMVDSYLSDQIIDQEYADYLEHFQPWRILILSGDNHKELFRSTERYFNKADAEHAIDIAFANKSNVYLRQAETGDIELRLATDTTQP